MEDAVLRMSSTASASGLHVAASASSRSSRYLTPRYLRLHQTIMIDIDFETSSPLFARCVLAVLQNAARNFVRSRMNPEFAYWHAACDVFKRPSFPRWPDSIPSKMTAGQRRHGWRWEVVAVSPFLLLKHSLSRSPFAVEFLDSRRVHWRRAVSTPQSQPIDAPSAVPAESTRNVLRRGQVTFAMRALSDSEL